MRLSEKTLELSFTAQLTERLGIPNAVWFGLTQEQEAQLGFDVASNVNGILIILQFKASSVIVHPHRYMNPRRRFTLPHAQLTKLQELAQAFPGAVHYVLPNIGTYEEIMLNPDFIAQSWTLEVNSLPQPFPVPTNTALRHYAYIDPPECEIRSEPIQAKLMPCKRFSNWLARSTRNSQEMVAWIRRHEFSFKGMRAYGVLIPPP